MEITNRLSSVMLSLLVLPRRTIQTFHEKDMAGKVCAVNFFFTTCKGVCPIMNNNLNKVYDDFKNEDNFMIVSHTCDPETDSAAQLKHYADSMKVDTHKWVFLTGRKDSLYLAARNSYLIDDPNNNVGNINDQFLHSQFVALVDKFGNVRGQIYDALKPDDVKLMEENIKSLLKETRTANSNCNGNIICKLIQHERSNYRHIKRKSA